MKRREFMAAMAAAPFVSSKSAGAATVFPVRFRKPNPYDSVLRYVAPGSDEFKAEKAAVELETRMRRIFAGEEAPPEGLRGWVKKRAQIRAARFFALPENRVRYEITRVENGLTHHETGLWALPDFRAIESSAISASEPYFRDVTGHVFGRAESFRKQLVPGNPWWRARLDSAAGIDVYSNQGIAVGDIDNDGADEILVCQPGGLPNRVYKIGPDGVARDITEHSGLGILDETTCALFADFRNSGKQDAVLLCATGPLLFLNQGDGRFVEQPDAFHFNSPPQGSFTGMAAADYDRDGRLDLYLCCYVYFQSEDQYQFPAPYHDARNGPPNFLFQNRPLLNRKMSFEDVTEQSGINQNNDRFSFAPAWCDFDGDGWPDLYVANDFGRNNLYRNRNGRFADEAAAAGVEDIGPGMSASWFDYDADGQPDLYISNMWTAAGQRLVRDAGFRSAKGNEEAYRRHTKGNSLYRNSGGGKFEETGPQQSVEMGRWAWGSGGFDFDLDGSPEILVATGMVTNGGAIDLESFFWRQVVARSPAAQKPAADYENGWSAINQAIREDYSWSGKQPNVFYVRRSGKFVDASGVSGLDLAEDTRSFAVTDFDGDGYPDLILKSRLGPQAQAMQNNTGSARRPIAILLRGTNSNRDAIGARVEVNGQTQWLSAGSGFLSQHSKRLHFGVGNKQSAKVKIFWPSGAKQELADLEPGYSYVVTEGEAHPARSPLRPRRPLPTSPIAGLNQAEYGDSWLLEPAPLPDQRRRGFLVLYAGARPDFPAGVPVEFVDVNAGDLAAVYAVFHRYLFEYRGPFSLPLVLLVDDTSGARKVYANIPDRETLMEDLANIDRFGELGLPFPGRYYKGVHRRNFYKFAAALYWAGYPEAAVPYLERAAEREQFNWKASLALARLLAETGRHKDALRAFRNVLAIRADYPAALVGAGEALAKTNDATGAREMFSRALAVDPKCADAANQLGILSAEAGDLNGARDWFQQAISIERDHSGAINNLGVLYAKMGKPDDAIAAFRYGIGIAPDDESLYMNLGRIYVTLGRPDEARALMEQLLERKPDNETARKALAELETR
jgi:Flp pilus assembly protein TadD